MDALMPTTDVIDAITQYAGVGFLVGFGFSLAFWVGGYAVGRLLGYLRGGY